MKIAMRKFMYRLLKARSGVTSIEYGLIASLIAVTIVSALSTIGNNELKGTFEKIHQSLG
jgi:pilus assembly protein Flp/PilA